MADENSELYIRQYEYQRGWNACLDAVLQMSYTDDYGYEYISTEWARELRKEVADGNDRAGTRCV